MIALRVRLDELPLGSLQVGPYPKPLTAAQEFEIDAALDAWDEAGYIGERLEDDHEVAAVAVVCDRIAHLREPGGRRKMMPLPRGAELRERYTIGRDVWSVERVETVLPNAESTI